MDGLFGGQQIAIGNRLLALHRRSQGRGCLLEDIGAHVLHDGTHDDNAGEKRECEKDGFSKAHGRRLQTQCVGVLFCVPFVVKLQGVFSIKWSHQLPDHSLRFLPLIPPQHSNVGHQPGHSTNGHTADLSLDVVCDLLQKKRKADTSSEKKRGRKA